MRSIAIVDYGAGNIYSLLKALRFLGVNESVAKTPSDIESADALILPGVGAFPAGMESLYERGVIPAIEHAAASGKWILGICLGAQLLMSEGDEFQYTQGLCLISGRVVKFPSLREGYRTPNINWNPVTRVEASRGDVWEGTPLMHTENDSQFYFVHSFVCEPTEQQHVLAQTQYGGHRFCSVYQDGHIVGCQFHPEKSGEVGLQFLKSFLGLVTSSM